MHQQQVVLANLGNDEGVSGLNIGGIVPLVVTDELRACLATNWKVVFDICETAVGILFVSEEQVEALLSSLHSNRLLSPLLANQVLLQRQKGAFMTGMLSHLNQRIPVMRSEILFAVGTL